MIEVSITLNIYISNKPQTNAEVVAISVSPQNHLWATVCNRLTNIQNINPISQKLVLEQQFYVNRKLVLILCCVHNEQVSY